MIFIINLKRFDNEEKDYYIPVLKSAIKDLSPIELLVMIFLYRYRSHYADLVLISVNHLVSSCGYIPNGRHQYKGRAEGVSFKFINTLKRLIEDDYINIFNDVDIDKLKPSDLFYVQLNMEKINFFANISFDNLDESGKKEYSFVLLEFPVMDKIIKSGVNDVAGLMYFYLYIKQFISIDEGKDYKHYALVTNDNLKDNVIVSNDKLYDSFVSTLQNLQIMYKHNFGYRMVDDILVQVPNAYVLDTKYFKEAYKGLKQQYKFCKLIPYENPNEIIGDIETVSSSSDPVETNNISAIKEDSTPSGNIGINPFNKKVDSSDGNISNDDQLPFEDEDTYHDRINRESVNRQLSFTDNVKVVKYKPFGGVMEPVKKIQKSVEDILEEENLSDDNIDLNCLDADYSEDYEEPESLRLTRELMEQSISDNDDYDITDDVITDMFSDRKKKGITPAEYMKKMDDRLAKERLHDDFAC